MTARLEVYRPSVIPDPKVKPLVRKDERRIASERLREYGIVVPRTIAPA